MPSAYRLKAFLVIMFLAVSNHSWVTKNKPEAIARNSTSERMRTIKKTSQTYLYIFTSILLVVLYSLFRAYMDQLTFLVALDKVVSTVISELWELISTPTVFFVLTATLIIYSLRKEIRQFFPAIKEIKAGAFSATMDFSRLINETMLDVDKKDINKTLNSEKTSRDVSDYLISRLGRESLQLMIEIVVKALTLVRFSK